MPEHGPASWFVGAILVLRLVEFWMARRNAERLLAAGGVEHAESLHTTSTLLLAAWLIALAVSIDDTTPLAWLPATAVGLLQLLRAWTLHALGRFWTPRIITLPGVEPVRGGPYRFCRHPWEIALAGEYLLAPLAVGLWWLALAASIANIPLMRERLRAQREAFAAGRPSRAVR